MSVICICLSPGLQHTVSIDTLIPGEVNRLSEVTVDVAGKGVNVCRALQRLGVGALCLAQGGSNADEPAALARLEGLDLRLIPSSGRLRTCTSIVEATGASGHRVTELVEPSSTVDKSCVIAMTKTVEDLLPSASALVVAGSRAPGYPAGYPARLARMATESGVPVILDMQGPDLRDAVIARPAVVKINLAEFVATFLADRFKVREHSGALAETDVSPDLTKAITEVSRDFVTSFVLTRGAKSTLLIRDGSMRVLPVPPLTAGEVINPIGSGDTFLAGMLAQLLKTDWPSTWESTPMEALEKAIEFATACAQSNARTARPGFLEGSFKAYSD
ncbi:putative PfkB domain protein [Candidatus Propionivibrio aalborgensis]|uniref:Phosphofructokinase n=2 Tax=Candidatus Propionivibrio aalborgensis TaxID=1860101 RepID=A0A1A8Y0Y8_9RHOO|nr:PfkB family carbohydrate kinase [Candidatus Propionivibrio aalborgensis]SBT10805.1 putative PfkB domain protein [Candidatus Propionivibrio aalborgensis]